MKLLLISPRHDIEEKFESPLSAFDASVGGYEMTPSTSIAAVAGLVPPQIDVTLCNEPTQEIDYGTDADVIGITANVAQAERALDIADRFKGLGKTVVFGGPHVSLAPDVFAGHCDSMVVGELESVAEAFFADMAAGALKPRYDAPAADMRASPPPRWDLYPHDRLVGGVMQYSRGCPFKCHFCDVIQYLGNRQRHKDPQQAIVELQNLYDLGFSSVLIADDNFTANRKKAHELLDAIADWNGADGRDYMTFQTQMSINMTQHDDMLAACHRAGVLTNFVGIETSDPQALEESDKRPNFGLDLVGQCEKSLRAGVRIEPGLIVGFDSDTLDSFEKQFQFTMRLPIGPARIGPLVAPVATPLYDDMLKQGRMLQNADLRAGAPSSYTSNFEPAQMSRLQLYIGLRWLITKFYNPENFLARLDRIVDLLAPPPWAGRGYRPSRKPRPMAARMAATVLRQANEADPGMRRFIGDAFAASRRRPEISQQISQIVVRFLAIHVNLRKMGMYDADWAELSAPPFDTTVFDERMERLRRWKPVRLAPGARRPEVSAAE